MSAHKKWLYAAAGLSALAGFIHVLAAPEHFEEWIGYGMFFFAAAAAQILFALMLAAYADNPHRDLLIAGIAGNAAIILLWLITRTLGIPFFGPEAGEVEPLGVLDSLSKITELALIACLAVLLRRRPVPASK